MGVGAALTVLVLFIACVDAENAGVEFSRKTFTMTCPGEASSWDFKDTKIDHTGQKYKDEYDNSKKGPYSCSYNDGTADKKYYFYVQGKVCENCFELDGNIFLFAIIADVVFTVGVMFVIYNCTKKKSSDESLHAPNESSRSGGRPPPIPNPDYERLNPRTQNQDPYSRLN